MDTSFLFQNCYTGTDFENLMVQFLGEHGFRAKKTGSNDGGIDIVATSITRPIKYSFNIQCKFFNKPLSKAPIQEVYAGTHYYNNGAAPVVITNDWVTAEARIAGHVGAAAIHLGTVLARQRAAMGRKTAVGVHHELAARETGACFKAALHKSAGGIDEDLRVLVRRKFAQCGQDDILHQVAAQGVEIGVLFVLAGQHDCGDALGESVFVFH